MKRAWQPFVPKQPAAGGIVQVANDNCPGQVVISGDRPGMEAAMAALSAAGAKKVVALAISIAAHSPLMQPASDALRRVIDATPITAPIVPVVADTERPTIDQRGGDPRRTGGAVDGQRTLDFFDAVRTDGRGHKICGNWPRRCVDRVDAAH